MVDKHDRAQLRLLIRRLRTERDVTQTKLAEQVGISQPRVAEIESGRREVRALELFAILDALGVSMATFWRRYQTAPIDGAPVSGRLDEESDSRRG